MEQEKSKQTRRKNALEIEVLAYVQFRKKKAELDKRRGKLYFLEFRDMQERGKELKSEKKAARKEFEEKSLLYKPLQDQVQKAKDSMKN